MESLDSLSDQTILSNFSFNLEDEVIKEEVRQALLETIKNLSERERTLLSLYYYNNMNMKEIAEVFHLTPATVGKIHQGILKKLKKNIEEKEKENGRKQNSVTTRTK